jgi:hypothetical protein
MSTTRGGKKGMLDRLTSVWAEDLPGTTYGLGPLLRSVVCRGRTQIADGVNRALAATEYVTGTSPRGGFDILRRNEVSTSCPTACFHIRVESFHILVFGHIANTRPVPLFEER